MKIGYPNITWAIINSLMTITNLIRAVHPLVFHTSFRSKLTSKTKGITIRATSISVGGGSMDFRPMARRTFSNHAASSKDEADVNSWSSWSCPGGNKSCWCWKLLDELEITKLQDNRNYYLGLSPRTWVLWGGSIFLKNHHLKSCWFLLGVHISKASCIQKHAPLRVFWSSTAEKPQSGSSGRFVEKEAPPTSNDVCFSELRSVKYYSTFLGYGPFLIKPM